MKEGRATSTCDNCLVPGYCCRSFSLFREGDEKTFWVDDQESIQLFLKDEELPFLVNKEIGRWENKEGREYATYSFRCPHLEDNGRCGIYEDRPKTCRIFEAGANPLCVHYQGTESPADDVIIPWEDNNA